MSADPDPTAANIEVVPGESIPPEWLVWADAIERREDLRLRVTRKAEAAGFREALASRSSGQDTSDWTEETLEFVAQLRVGTDRPELHGPPRRRWGLSRNASPAGEGSR